MKLKLIPLLILLVAGAALAAYVNTGAGATPVGGISDDGQTRSLHVTTNGEIFVAADGGAISVQGAGIDGGVLPTAPLCTTRSYQRHAGTAVTAATALDIAINAYACNQLVCSVQVNQYLSAAACSGSPAAATDAPLAAWTPLYTDTIAGEAHWCVYPSATGTCWALTSN